MELRLKITDFLFRNPAREFTINEIAGALKEYYSFVHRTVKRLAAEGVIVKKKAGKAYLCSLNPESEKALALIQLGEIEKSGEFFAKNRELKLVLDDFLKGVGQRAGIASAVLFGSFAKGSATKGSDIDVLLVGKVSGIDRKVKETYAKYGREISPLVMGKAEFSKQRSGTLVSEIISDHYVVYGADRFIRLVFGK